MSGYIGATPVPQATQHREAFTATASQTSFATVGYTPQFVDVYLNGVKLAAADYTATNGSDIVLTTGAALNDILEYVAYTPFEVADQTFTGTTTVTDSGAAPLVANRTTSDGDITVFQKDGTVVGSIGATQSGVNIYYAGGAGKSGVEYSNTAWRPWYDGARADNSIDLGTTVNRFKDFYLSGGVYLGGTGAANYLDDYEEGTWTPVVEFGGGSVGIVYSIQVGKYTKVGNVVTISTSLSLTNKGSSTGNAYITGLPFTATADLAGSQGGGVAAVWSGCNSLLGITVSTTASSSELSLWRITSSTSSFVLRFDDADASNDFSVNVTMQYYTDA